MASINDLTLARKLTEHAAEACNGLESGSAPILDQVSQTTAELLKWWVQDDFKDTREFNFHDGQRAGTVNVIYAHEVLGMTALEGLYGVVRAGSDPGQRPGRADDRRGQE